MRRSGYTKEELKLMISKAQKLMDYYIDPSKDIHGIYNDCPLCYLDYIDDNCKCCQWNYGKKDMHERCMNTTGIYKRYTIVTLRMAAVAKSLFAKEVPTNVISKWRHKRIVELKDFIEDATKRMNAMS